MTSDEVELFISLKFSNTYDVIAAFTEAIKQPAGYLIKHSNPAEVEKGIHKWAEAGCPDSLEITPEDTDLFIRIKFGNIQNAYWWWSNTPPGSPHGLTKHEELKVLDYVPDTK